MWLPARTEDAVGGRAGLSAATRLADARCDLLVLEAGRQAGGRLGTDDVDGFVVDRGFKVLDTGYPRAADLDLDALRLGLRGDGGTVQAAAAVVARGAA